MLVQSAGLSEQRALGEKMQSLYVLLAISLLLNATIASAYCPSYPDVEQEFWESDFVFVGKVISEEKVNETKDGYFDGTNYQIAVSESLHGKPGQVVTEFSENSSGRFPMVIGESYLVFTSITPGTFAGIPVYTVSSCGNSGEVSKKRDALLLARKLSKSARNQPNR